MSTFQIFTSIRLFGNITEQVGHRKLLERKHVPYSTYYKPMGDLPYISSEQGGGLIMRITIYKRLIPIQELRAEDGDGLIIHHGLIIRTIRYC